MLPRVLVCGGRTYYDKKTVYNTLNALCDSRGWNGVPDQNGNYLPRVVIIHGGARGADSLADDWAVINWCAAIEFKADWGQYGKRAGYIRNKQMLEEGKPDIVVAFPGRKGTTMMVDIAMKAGVEVLQIHE